MSTVTEQNKVFTLSNGQISYIFRVDDNDELIHVQYGADSGNPPPPPPFVRRGWVSELGRIPREYADSGRGDFRIPAYKVRHGDGCTVTSFRYADYSIEQGKPRLEGLPSTFASKDEASTISIHLRDEISKLDLFLDYTIYSDLPVICRSTRITNSGAPVVIEHLASLSVDLPNQNWEMIQLTGDWAKEAQIIRRKVYPGVQSIQSSTGYSSHLHNPFLALVSTTTTETEGDAYGFNLVYSGSFSAEVEHASHDLNRVVIGLNPSHLAWNLASGETFTTPECVSVYSSTGLGGMSRAYHRLYRDHLIRSKFTNESRPTLINNWEATYFNFDSARLFDIASTASKLGVKLFVMDDGWFGEKHPRVNDRAGLGDWIVNPARFPNGLNELVDKINGLKTNDGPMKFGIWLEPEMINPDSELYETHPDWVLHAGKYPRTQQRQQLVLDLSRQDVQDYLIDRLSSILSSANIAYVKWDNNRGMHELKHPSVAHQYMLGLYRVLDILTTRFPDILWEGCASGGGRFDAGLLPYFPQSWTSDNTDGLDRLGIQFGTSLCYPPSSFGGHVAAVPNHQTGRTVPFEFRAHVAMMCGSFGFELDSGALTEEEQHAMPDLIALSERISPLVITGDLYRLSRPDESNWPAAQYTSADRTTTVVLVYAKSNILFTVAPPLRLQNLIPEAYYKVDGAGPSAVIQGKTLMGAGLRLKWVGDYQSRVIWVAAV